MAALDRDREYLRAHLEHPTEEHALDVGAVLRVRAVRRQLLDTDGVMGFSMLAEPLRKRYATLSVWQDGPRSTPSPGRTRTIG